MFALVAACLVPSHSAISAPGPTTIRRDGFGVPHINAPSQDALAFAMGVALVEDRPFQVDIYRRAAQGRLSEVLGEGPDDDNSGTGDYLEADILMRQEFFERGRLKAQVDAWDPDLRSLWESYASGITAGWVEVNADPTRSPVEFGASGYQPEPWTVLDSLSVSLLFSIVDNGAWGGDGEFENADLLARLKNRFGNEDGEAIWRESVWMNDQDTSTVIPDEDASEAPDGIPDIPDRISQAQLAADPPTAKGAANEALIGRVVRDLGLPKFGSYAAAISPEKSESGGAMFLGAPQSGISAPQYVWEVGMHAPGIDCAGGAVPGAGPFLIMGRCRQHAFSIVAGVAGDTVDNVVERRSGEDGYLYDGVVEPFERRTETFTIRGTPPAAEQEFRTEQHEFVRSRHGPVFDMKDDVAYVRKYAQAGHEIDNLTSLFRLTTAQTLGEADAAVEEASWSVHTLYADIEGNIAYWYTGLNPIHAPGLDPRLPTPGESSANEWSFIPKSQNPQVVNPEQGFLVANQGYDSKPVNWWQYSDDWRLSAVERREWNDTLVEDRVPITMDDIKEINKLACCDVDPIVGFMADAVREAVALYPTARRQEAIAHLDAWEATGFRRPDANPHDDVYDLPGIAIWSADELPGIYHGTSLPTSSIWDNLFNLTFPDQLPAFAYYGVQDRLQASHRSLRQARGEPIAVPLTHDYFDNVNTPQTETWQELMVEAIDSGLAAIGSRFGTSDMSAWRDPVNKTPVETLGALAVDNLEVSDHSSYNFIIDFGAAESGWSILPPGQGAPVSAAAYALFQIDGTYPEHYVDQVEMYENFEFKPLSLFASEYESAPVSRVVVFPGPVTNHAPHASDDEAETNENVAIDIDVLANDYDRDGDTVTVQTVGTPAHGRTEIASPGVVRYTPAADYNGDDSFTYTVTDGSLTDEARVSVSVEPVFVPRTLTVAIEGDGSGSVSSTPAGIVCPSDCTHDYDRGTAVKLGAQPAAGSRFTGWSGACTGTGVCEVSMSVARSVTATFERIRHVLDVSTDGDGSGTVTSDPAGIDCPSDCTHTYDEGTSVTLHAQPTSGSTFTGWSGACAGTADCTLSMSEARSAAATFERNRHTLSVSRDGEGSGTVSSDPAGIDCPSDCTEVYDEGTSVTLHAQPTSGSTFTGWSGACTGTGDCTLSMSEARSAAATFERNRHTLSVAVDGDGSGTVSSDPSGIDCPSDCTHTYDEGTSVTLHAQPTSGSTFTGWSGACAGTADCTLSMSEARSAAATFERNRHTLSVSRDGEGSGTVSSDPAGIDCPSDCTEVYDEGTGVTLVAHAAPGSAFASWSDACSGTDDCALTMSQARSVAARFERIDSDTLVFSTERYGAEEIASVGTDGGGVKRITKNRSRDYAPAVSSDGSRIAYLSDRSGSWDVYVMDVNGSHRVRVTSDRATEREPAWSADGAKLLFSTTAFGGEEIVSVDPDGSNLTRLGAGRSPAVSPDGRKVAFVSNGGISVMDIDGSNPAHVTDGTDPAWTIDGSRLVFVTDADDIASVAVDGSGPAVLARTKHIDRDPAVSPNGEVIAFGSSHDVYLMDLDGSDIRRLTRHSKTDRSPSWVVSL